MTISFRRLLVVLAALVVASTARAQTPIFSDNFDSYSPGALPSTPYNWDNNGAILTDSGNLLQEGTNNQFVQLTTGQNLGIYEISGPTTTYPVASLSFSLYMPSSTNEMFVELANEYSYVGGENIINGTIDSSGGPVYIGTPVQFTFVVNTGATAVNYLSAAQSGDTIPANSIQVWENGTLVVNGWQLASTTNNPPINGFIFSVNPTNGGTFDIDNVAFYNGAVVGALPAATPEPSVTGYLVMSLAVGGLGWLFRKRFLPGAGAA